MQNGQFIATESECMLPSPVSICAGLLEFSRKEGYVASNNGSFSYIPEIGCQAKDLALRLLSGFVEFSPETVDIAIIAPAWAAYAAMGAVCHGTQIGTA